MLGMGTQSTPDGVPSVAHVGTHISLAGTRFRSTQLIHNGPDHRRERLRRAVSSSAAPPGKNTTAAAAVQPRAHAGERTLSGTVPSGICTRPGDARRAMSLVASGPDAHTRTLTRTLRLGGHRHGS